MKVFVVAQERLEGREREGAHRGAGCATDFAQDAAQDAAQDVAQGAAQGASQDAAKFRPFFEEKNSRNLALFFRVVRNFGEFFSEHQSISKISSKSQ